MPAAPALANDRIKDRTHAGMQKMPALLASLHGLSAFDDAGEYSRDHAEAADRVEQAHQQRERKEQEEIDKAAALRLQ